MNIHKLEAALFAALIGAGAAAATPAHAYIFGFSNVDANNAISLYGTTTLSNAGSGWFYSNGTHTTTNRNYIAAQASDVLTR